MSGIALTKTWMLSLISFVADGTVQTFALAGFVLFVISRVAKYRRGLRVCWKRVDLADRLELIVLDRMLAICQVCVFRFIHWPYLALPSQHQDGMQDTVSLGLGVVHVWERLVLLYHI
jgi:hypothetical protein